MTWHGRSLLYSSADGQRAIIDTGSGRVLDLGKLARALSALSSGEQANAYWRSDFS